MKYDVTLQTIAWLNGRRNDETLEISPQFQRRPVWLVQERSELIATIMEALPFPEIYIHHRTEPEHGTERHIVVDGQQRVTSIIMFIDGEISLPDSDRWRSRAFNDLDPTEKEHFWDYKVVVRALSGTNDAEIRDLFIRLNTNNIALNDQELRNARHKGRFKLLAERVADNPLFQQLGLFTARDIRRMLDVEFSSELVLLTIEGITNKKDLLDGAYSEYDEELPQEAQIEGELAASLGLIRSVINDDNAAQIRRRSNFYSLVGACLKYHRQNARASFRHPDAVGSALADLLLAVRQAPPEASPIDQVKYHEAVTRAASDKGRRAERDRILFDLIERAETP